MDIRDAFFDRVYELARQDPNLIFLTDDMDAFSLRRFKQEMPAQFVNIGVAEQNLINVAAGLAMGGKRVFAYGIASFVTMRAFEQIKVNLCSMRLPVTLIGVGAGFSFGFDGPTHHGTQDVAILRALPEMTIFNPSDGVLAAACAEWALRHTGPVYVRLDKGPAPALGDVGREPAPGFRILRPLQETNLLGSGFMVREALRVAEALEREGRPVGVVDVYQLKPVSERLVEEVLRPSQRIVSLEDHSLIGGLGSLVSEVVADHRLAVPILRCGAADRQFLQYGSREWFHALNGLDVPALVERLR